MTTKELIEKLQKADPGGCLEVACATSTDDWPYAVSHVGVQTYYSPDKELDHVRIFLYD